MIPSRPTLRQLLRKLAVEPVPAPDGPLAAHEDAPWFVRVMIGFGAWVAAVCFVGFFELLHLLDHGASTTTVALLLLVASAAVWFRARGAFLVQLALAASLTGQAMFCAGIMDGHVRSGREVWGVMAVLEAVLVLVNVDRVHRYLSTVASLLFLGAALHSDTDRVAWDALEVGLVLSVSAALWLEPELAATRGGDAYSPVTSGLTSFLFLLVLAGPVERMTNPATHQRHGVLLSLVATTLLVALLLHVGKGSSPRVIAGAFTIMAVGVVCRNAPGVLIAPLVVGLGLCRRNFGIVALAIVFFAFFVVSFYYDLDMTLLAKSGVLVGSGALVFASILLVPKAGAA